MHVGTHVISDAIFCGMRCRTRNELQRTETQGDEQDGFGVLGLGFGNKFLLLISC